MLAAMCGIAGLALRNKPADLQSLHAFASALAHRGPDACGTFLSAGVGLVHTRLAIVDLAGGAQPLYDETANLALVCNGEIYNHGALRRELEALGHRFATDSDCECIVHAYRQWGPDCLERFEGMFAFALFDRRFRTLFLARDRYGIKPLYLLRDADGISFASEIKALIGAQRGSRHVNPTALLQYLHCEYSTGRDTLIRGIERLLPGEACLVRHGEIVQRWRYYAPPLAQRTLEQPAALHDRFDALMETVMRDHLRCDVPMGLFLSGGIDSTLLATLLREQLGAGVPSYSIGFASPEVHSELAAARSVAQACGMRHTELTVTGDELLASLPHAIWSADELLGDTACLAVALLAERARAEVKVIFTGEGADEAFAGYARYRSPPWKRWMRRLRAPAFGGMRSGGDAKDFTALFGEALIDDREQWQGDFAQAWQATAEAGSAVRRMQAVDLATWLPDDLLLKCDRMTMSEGIEARVPYLDRRLLEFGLALPDSLKVRGRLGKFFLRAWGSTTGRAMGVSMWAPKRGLSVPIATCLSESVLQKLQIVLPASAGIAQWFRPQAVQRLITRVIAGSGEQRMVWALLQFAIWYNLFIDGAAPTPPGKVQDITQML